MKRSCYLQEDGQGSPGGERRAAERRMQTNQGPTRVQPLQAGSSWKQNTAMANDRRALGLDPYKLLKSVPAVTGLIDIFLRPRPGASTLDCLWLNPA